MKEWFRARNAWGVSIKTLTDEEAGRLMKALWEYTMTGQQAELRGREDVIYALMLFTLQQDDENDQAIAIKRSVSGTVGGRPRKANAFSDGNEKAKKAIAFSDDDEKAKKANAFSDGDEKAKKANAFSDEDEKAKKANAFSDGDEKAKKANAFNKNKNQNKNKEEESETEFLFAIFWDAYPRHEAKEAAWEAFEELNPDEGLLETMTSAIEKWKKTDRWKDDGGRYIPNPANWLKQRRWEDEVPRPAPVKGAVTAQQYEQRDYSGVQEEMLDTQRREIEEKLRRKEEKKTGGEDT